jgi:hypothetical protein
MEINLEIIGVWILVLMTLSILSYLYGDNPFYKTAEHIFVGVSAGYVQQFYKKDYHHTNNSKYLKSLKLKSKHQ